MIDLIMCHPELSGILRRSCDENNICIEICDELLVGDDLNDDLIQILKVDEYYSSKNMHNPPPSIDCLIILKTGENEFGFILVELRNVKGTALIKPKEIIGKYKTTVERFMLDEFSSIFCDDMFTVSFFKLWLVTNPFKIPNLSDEQYERKIKGTVLEQYNSVKPLRFKNKVAIIEPMAPWTEICI